MTRMQRRISDPARWGTVCLVLTVLVSLATVSVPAAALEVAEPKGELIELGEVFIESDVCPFECCTYGDWVVVEETDLVNKPGGEEVVTSAGKCDEVVGLTGEVHIRPVEAVAMIDFADALGNVFTKGDRFHLLTPRGEGFRLAWAGGAFFEMDASGVRSRGECEPEPERCWVLVDSHPESIWWMKIQTNSGEIGWSREYHHFDGFDSCAFPRADCPESRDLDSAAKVRPDR